MPQGERDVRAGLWRRGGGWASARSSDKGGGAEAALACVRPAAPALLMRRRSTQPVGSPQPRPCRPADTPAPSRSPPPLHPPSAAGALVVSAAEAGPSASYELVLAGGGGTGGAGGGKILGSREFARYYRQRHRPGDARESVQAAQVQAQYRRLAVPLLVRLPAPASNWLFVFKLACWPGCWGAARAAAAPPATGVLARRSAPGRRSHPPGPC